MPLASSISLASGASVTVRSPSTKPLTPNRHTFPPKSLGSAILAPPAALPPSSRSLASTPTTPPEKVTSMLRSDTVTIVPITGVKDATVGGMSLKYHTSFKFLRCEPLSPIWYPPITQILLSKNTELGFVLPIPGKAGISSCHSIPSEEYHTSFLQLPKPPVVPPITHIFPPATTEV